MAQNDFSMHLDNESYIRAMATLSSLSDIEKQEVVAQGLKEGAQIIAKQTKANVDSRVQKRTGNLSKSVAVLNKKKSGKAYAGFKRPMGAHAHLLEFGWVTRKGTRMQGKHFHSDAVESKGQEAMNTVVESIELSIKRILNRN